MGWGPVEWVGRGHPEPKFEMKCTLFFEIFWFELPLLRYQLKTVFGDHLNGLGTSWLGVGGHPEPKLKNKCTLFFEIFWFERPLLRYLLKTVFGDQLNGLGTSWLGVGGHPEPKFKNKCTLFFEIFWFERDKRRCYNAGRTTTITEDRATQPMKAGGWVLQFFIFFTFRVSQKM